MEIELKILDKKFYKERDLPTYATDGSGAIDLIATETVILYPQEIKTIHTGIAISMVRNHYSMYDDPSRSIAAIILPRSSTGRSGLMLSNTIGLIDQDYQGELLVSAWNRNNASATLWNIHECRDVIEIEKGERFAQLMFVPIFTPQFSVVENFTNTTERGDGGFGSTGLAGKIKC